MPQHVPTQAEFDALERQVQVLALAQSQTAQQVDALEAKQSELAEGQAILARAVSALEARVTALEAAPIPNPPAPVDCIPGTVLIVSETDLEACQPDGFKAVEVVWERVGDIPESHGGIPCGP